MPAPRIAHHSTIEGREVATAGESARYFEQAAALRTCVWVCRPFALTEYRQQAKIYQIPENIQNDFSLITLPNSEGQPAMACAISSVVERSIAARRVSGSNPELRYNFFLLWVYADVKFARRRRTPYSTGCLFFLAVAAA